MKLDEDDVINAVDDILRKIGEDINKEAKKNCVANDSIASAELIRGFYLTRLAKGKWRVGNNAPYACVIGSKQKVKTDNGYISIRQAKNVLSKDGKVHKSIPLKTGNFKDKPNGIIIKCEKMRGKGLFVTDDHLILSYRYNIPVWIKAKDLVVGDYVFRPRKKNPYKGCGEIEGVCSGCGEKFIHKYWDNKKYCCMDCYHDNTDHNRNEGCRWNLTDEQIKKHEGANNGAWKGGTSKEPYGVGWTRRLKNDVKKRDGYKCVKCGMVVDGLHVHHIDGDKFNNDMDNLITLCPSCHGKEQWQDCELVDVDMETFEMVKIKEIELVHAFDITKTSIKGLYDLNVDGENSYVCGGILIHNSIIEYGRRPSDKLPPVDKIESWIKDKKSITLKRVRRGGHYYLYYISKEGKLITSRKWTPKTPKRRFDLERDMAWAIAKSIQKSGFEARPYFRPAVYKKLNKFRS